jgi:hypothetical protein
VKFKVLITLEDGMDARMRSPWSEDYNRAEILNLQEAAVWGENLIQRFNNSLRPGETPRKYVGVEEAPDSDALIPHEWQKTNLVTIIKGLQVYDTAICLRCNITAKRFGLDGYTIDPKFKKHLSCEVKA